MKNPSFALAVLLAITTSGCGFGGQQFHGSYNVAGTVTIALTGQTTMTNPLSFTYRISEGANSDILISEIPVAGTPCTYPADVEGDVATLRPGTTCTLVQNGHTFTKTITNGIASLSGKAVQLNYSGNLMFTGEGKTYPGTIIQNATLTRVGK
ncbi:hypothetical protein [Archangium lipolyticum]|uniref:hypothetical protein n=1 Tax=Archangium lipolyticum TaxID=2970465 RepID=UPI00214A24CF|nr:hypothetical protein [Archangium lipolyticum]